LPTAVLFVLLLAGCGGDDGPPVADDLGYFLDPPELGEQTFEPVTEGVPVLCYHYFRGNVDPGYLARVLGSILFGMPALGPREFWTTPAGEFEKHLRYFRDQGIRVMTLDEIADLRDQGQPVPARAVVLTADDADRSFHRYAYPLLKKYGVKMHLFVPTAHVGRPWSELDVCTWDQLREMTASGHVIVGSHTRDLHFKVDGGTALVPVFWAPDRVPDPISPHALSRRAAEPGLEPSRWRDADVEAALAGEFGPVAADLVASRLDIAANLGIWPDWLAWPYGHANGELEDLARQVGFRGTVTLRPEAFTEENATYEVGRYTLTAKTTLEILAGIYGE
jgi:peptidoglycan/xylan/chitin deacetylase (PgdA/CDA1 family)